jgi:hypothetical protein
VSTETSLCARKEVLSACQGGSLSLKKVTCISLLSPPLDGCEHPMRIYCLIGLGVELFNPAC